MRGLFFVGCAFVGNAVYEQRTRCSADEGPPVHHSDHPVGAEQEFLRNR